MTDAHETIATLTALWKAGCLDVHDYARACQQATMGADAGAAVPTTQPQEATAGEVTLQLKALEDSGMERQVRLAATTITNVAPNALRD